MRSFFFFSFTDKSSRYSLEQMLTVSNSSMATTMAMISSPSIASYLLITLDFFFKHVYLLLLVIIGGIGNLFVIIMFGQKAFRTTIRCIGSSMSVYPFLFYMAISDTMYLIIMFCLWLSNYVNVLHRPVICQLTLYLTYVCNFINAYYTIAFTAQRFFAVVKPFRVSHVLSWYRSRCLALVIVFIAGGIYSYIPFSVSVESGRCYSREKFRQVNKYMDIIDCILVFLIPYIVIITMNTIIVISLRQIKTNQHEILFRNPSQFNQMREMTRRNASRKMTNLLLTVSTAYLIICAPYACIHTCRLLFYGDRTAAPSYLRLLEHYSHFVYHISFAMNFYLYIVFGSKFRRELRRLLSKSQQNFDQMFRERNRLFEHEHQVELNEKNSPMTTVDDIFQLKSTRKTFDQDMFSRQCCCCHFQFVVR